MSTPNADDLIGQTIGPYVIGARVGGGGMGVVYQARDTKLGRTVALKFLPPQWSHDEDARQRFIREAQAASATNHPNICTIHDIATAPDGQLFIVMAYYEGQTLKQRLASGPLGIDESLDIATQIADGLAKAHAQSVVHRDVKPGNVILTEDGARIVDFGLATFADALKLTVEHSTLGTAAYMSPEQVRGQTADARSDVWAVGVILYEMLTGHVPFQGSHAEAIAYAVRNETAAPIRATRPEVGEDAEQLVFRAMHKDPSIRFANGRDLARALRQVRGQSMPLDLRTEVVVAPHPPVSKVRRLPRWKIATAGVALTGVLAVTTMWLVERLAPPAATERGLPENKNVAVFPLEFVGGTPQDQAWATGLSAAVSTWLTRLAASTPLQVVRFDDMRSSQLDAAGVRSDQGATLILAGTVQRAGPSMRIAYSLRDTATSQELRKATFDVPSSDPTALQSRLLEMALELLAVHVAASERESLLPRDTTVAAANTLYLEGRGYLQYYEKPENIDGAIAAFMRALELDSKYAKAHAGLGEAYWRKYYETKQLQWSENAQTNCGNALVLNPQLAEAHICLGRLHDGRGRYESAAVEFEQALQTEPTNDDAYAGLGHAQEMLGRMDRAEETYQRAVDLRPRYWVNHNRLGHFYYNAGRYADAVEMFLQVVALTPDGFRGYSNLGGAYIQLARYDDAIAALERSRAIRATTSNTSNLGTAYFNRGRFTEAARAFEQAVKLVDTNPELWGNLGDAYHWAPDERPRAAAAYRRAISLGRSQLTVNPKDAALLVKLGHYHTMLGERKDALALVERALRIAPSDGFVLFKSAVTLNNLEATDRALDLLEKARAAGYSVTIIRDTPDLGNLWRYPRFQDLVRGR
ncbi:MAG TPA: protein kinase [Vicinamibacterales bacterium]|nr:protein kinase [Vicinamibacterales bacterium]